MKIPFSIKQSLHVMRLPESKGKKYNRKIRENKNRHSQKTKNKTYYQEQDWKNLIIHGGIGQKTENSLASDAENNYPEAKCYAGTAQ